MTFNKKFTGALVAVMQVKELDMKCRAACFRMFY
jgi:hypothetical protein